MTEILAQSPLTAQQMINIAGEVKDSFTRWPGIRFDRFFVDLALQVKPYPLALINQSLGDVDMQAAIALEQGWPGSNIFVVSCS